MAAITTTAADIRPLHPAAVIRRYNAGGTVTPGQAVYIASDGDVEAADADAEASALAIGIVCGVGAAGALSAAAGDRVDVCVFGPVTGFASMTPGAPVYASVTAGAMDHTPPAGASGDFRHSIGYAESATTIFVNPSLNDLTAL
jgi:hypothetical protein